jgi:hypothetical protein
MTEPQKWVLTKAELYDILNRDFGRLKERMELLEKNKHRTDVLKGLIQDANSMVGLAKSIIDGHYKDASPEEA